MRLSRLLIVSAACALALLLPGCARQAPVEDEPAISQEPSGTITVAIAGMVTPQEGLQYYKELSAYVGEKVGRPVRLVHKADYAQVNDMLEAGQVDIAYVCAGPYVKGHDEFGLQLIAAPVVNGQPAYYSYVLAARSSDATSLASLKGKRFAYTDPESNTGYLVPRFMIKEMGGDPDGFFSKTIFTYGHDNSIRAVAMGEVDGAAVDSLIWDYQQATNPAYTSKTKIIERSQEFAIPPVVARPGLEPSLVQAIREAFLTAHEDPRGKTILDKMKIEGFVVIEDRAYDSIRRMDEQLAE